MLDLFQCIGDLLKLPAASRTLTSVNEDQTRANQTQARERTEVLRRQGPEDPAALHFISDELKTGAEAGKLR